MTISGTPDLWWLSESQASQSWFLGVGHHAPLTDDDDQASITSLDQEKPVIPGWFHSLDEGRPSPSFKLYSRNFLDQWRAECLNTNVYRTMKLFPERSGQQPVLGPFLVDIDNQDRTNGYSENLDDALSVARQAVGFFVSRCLGETADFRVFFSGRKGFNIEVRPEALEIDGPIAQQLELSNRRLEEVIEHLRKLNNLAGASNVVSQRRTQIDRIYGSQRFGCQLKHPYIRFHDSWNKWISGGTLQRMRLELSVDMLRSESIESICLQAENRSGIDHA